LNVSGFTFAQAQAGQGAFNFDRIAKWGFRNDDHVFAFHHAEFQQPLDQGRWTSKRLDATWTAGQDLVESCHQE